MDLNENTRDIVENQMDEKIREYLSLGKDRLKALGYNLTYLNKELQGRIASIDTLDALVYSEFNVGDRISRTEAKQKLSSIYQKVGINLAGKSTDLEKWFELEETSFRENGKKLVGFVIISKKS